MTIVLEVARIATNLSRPVVQRQRGALRFGAGFASGWVGAVRIPTFRHGAGRRFPAVCRRWPGCAIFRSTRVVSVPDVLPGKTSKLHAAVGDHCQHPHAVSTGRGSAPGRCRAAQWFGADRLTLHSGAVRQRSARGVRSRAPGPSFRARPGSIRGAHRRELRALAGETAPLSPSSTAGSG